MVLRENKNNAYAKFGRENKEYIIIFGRGLQVLCFGKGAIFASFCDDGR